MACDIRIGRRRPASTMHKPANAPPILWPVKIRSCSGAISKWGARSSSRASARNRKPAWANVRQARHFYG